jgi:hypothetical protein
VLRRLGLLGRRLGLFVRGSDGVHLARPDRATQGGDIDMVGQDRAGSQGWGYGVTFFTVVFTFALFTVFTLRRDLFTIVATLIGQFLIGHVSHLCLRFGFGLDLGLSCGRGCGLGQGAGLRLGLGIGGVAAAYGQHVGALVAPDGVVGQRWQDLCPGTFGLGPLFGTGIGLLRHLALLSGLGIRTR